MEGQSIFGLLLIIGILIFNFAVSEAIAKKTGSYAIYDRWGYNGADFIAIMLFIAELAVFAVIAHFQGY